MSEPIRIGTRGSILARIQADLVVDALSRTGQPSRIVVVETDGDRRAPDTAWGQGAFVAAIEQALLDGRVDVAVHSAKDVPTGMDARLRVGAYLARADPRDALVVRADSNARRLEDLSAGSRVGTDSPRRTGFLLAARPDLHVHPLHGNVDTRLRRLDDGETDALVLACAGLDRLGRGDRIVQRIDPAGMPPAPGQGAIAAQVRTDDDRVGRLLAAIDDAGTRVAVEAERAFLAASGGGCRSPIGALATVSDRGLELLGGYATPTGSTAFTFRRSGSRDEGHQIAVELARDLAAAGRRVIVARPAGQGDDLIAALLGLGLNPVTVPAIAVEIEPAGGRFDALLAGLQPRAWVVVTSANGARATIAAGRRAAVELAGARWAAIGDATTRALAAAGFEVAFRPSQPSADALGLELPVVPGERVLVVRGDLAGTRLADALRQRGADVDDVSAYRTIEAPEASRTLLQEAFGAGPIGAIVLTSASSARGLATLARLEGIVINEIPAICIGPATTLAAKAAGFRVATIASTPDPIALATAVADVLALHPEPRSVPMEASR